MQIDWEAILDRIESGETTGDDADYVRDLLDRVEDLEMLVARLGGEDELQYQADGIEEAEEW